MLIQGADLLKKRQWEIVGDPNNGVVLPGTCQEGFLGQDRIASPQSLLAMNSCEPATLAARDCLGARVIASPSEGEAIQRVSPAGTCKSDLHPMAKRQVRDGAVQERDFFQDVMDVVRQIPRGRVTSYGAIAKYLGAARSARIVGYCMNNSHVTHPPVPAHRVVNSSGLLTGKHHFATPTRMENLLKKEGVKVKNDQVVDFAKKFWDPMVELGL